jgi:hypothetical protein
MNKTGCLCGYSFSNPSVKHYCELVANIKQGIEHPSYSIPIMEPIESSASASSPVIITGETIDNFAGKEENIKVIVRVRPLLRHEAERGTEAKFISLSPPDGKSLTVSGQEMRHKLKVKFDAAFGEESTQNDVYSMIKECSTAVVDGFNTTVFAYGQTGTG